MSNLLFERYMLCCNDVEKMMTQYQGSSEDAKKLRGALAAELIKTEIESYFKNQNKNFKVSTVNSYIAGSKYEYDLLIVKKEIEPYMGILYKPEDVVAIIECKASGLFDVDNDTSRIAKAINCVLHKSTEIRFGYITMSENVPKNQFNRYGNPTVKHWDLTVEYLNKKIAGQVASYAVTLHKGKDLCDHGKDQEFIEFIDFLIDIAEQ